MLLITRLSLLYLMVLIYGHPLFHNIDNDEGIDEVSDTLHPTHKHHRIRYDRIHQRKHKTTNKDEVTNIKRRGDKTATSYEYGWWQKQSGNNEFRESKPKNRVIRKNARTVFFQPHQFSLAKRHTKAYVTLTTTDKNLHIFSPYLHDDIGKTSTIQSIDKQNNLLLTRAPQYDSISNKSMMHKMLRHIYHKVKNRQSKQRPTTINTFEMRPRESVQVIKPKTTVVLDRTTKQCKHLPYTVRPAREYNATYSYDYNPEEPISNTIDDEDLMLKHLKEITTKNEAKPFKPLPPISVDDDYFNFGPNKEETPDNSINDDYFSLIPNKETTTKKNGKKFNWPVSIPVDDDYFNFNPKKEKTTTKKKSKTSKQPPSIPIEDDGLNLSPKKDVIKNKNTPTLKRPPSIPIEDDYLNLNTKKEKISTNKKHKIAAQPPSIPIDDDFNYTPKKEELTSNKNTKASTRPPSLPIDDDLNVSPKKEELTIKKNTKASTLPSSLSIDDDLNLSPKTEELTTKKNTKASTRPPSLPIDDDLNLNPKKEELTTKKNIKASTLPPSLPLIDDDLNLSPQKEELTTKKNTKASTRPPSFPIDDDLNLSPNTEELTTKKIAKTLKQPSSISIDDDYFDWNPKKEEIAAKKNNKNLKTPNDPIDDFSIMKPYKEKATTIPSTKADISNELTNNPTDDYFMIKVYEKMLKSAHKKNYMKMISKTYLPVAQDKKQYKKVHYKISKRNSDTLTDHELEETVTSVNDEITMPDYENSEFNNPLYTVTDTTELFNFGGHKTTEVNDLKKKIAYDDFVDGYKHYLKFQKDEANQNFSAMVRYQAHRHHSVDDIGKYILNKIPQIPPGTTEKERKKRLFEDIGKINVINNNDTSWLKKHFYIFYESGPSKKFHTSETVSLKLPTEDIKVDVHVYVPTTKSSSLIHSNFAEKFIRFDKSDESKARKTSISQFSLDDLSKLLEQKKNVTEKYSSAFDSKAVTFDTTPSTTTDYMGYETMPVKLTDGIDLDSKDIHVKPVTNVNIATIAVPIERQKRAETFLSESTTQELSNAEKEGLAIKVGTKTIIDTAGALATTEPGGPVYELSLPNLSKFGISLNSSSKAISFKPNYGERMFEEANFDKSLLKPMSPAEAKIAEDLIEAKLAKIYKATEITTEKTKKKSYHHRKKPENDEPDIISEDLMSDSFDEANYNVPDKIASKTYLEYNAEIIPKANKINIG